MYDYSNLPEGLQDGMKRYIENGLLAGGFLTACLENNLVDAVNRADEKNLPRLQEIVKWIYWEAPHDCWGSKEKVARWRKNLRSVGEVNKGIKTHFEHMRKADATFPPTPI